MTTDDQEQNKKNTRLIAQLMHKQLKQELTKIKEEMEEEDDNADTESSFSTSSYTTSSAQSNILQLQSK